MAVGLAIENVEINTDKVRLLVFTQPELLLVPVMEYVVVMVGLTEIEGPVPPVLQLYVTFVEGLLTEITAVCPEQSTGMLELTPIFASWFTWIN